MKEFNFKHRIEAPEGDIDIKKFTKKLKWGLLVQVGYVLMKTGHIKFNWDETGCTVTLDFFVKEEEETQTDKS